MSGNKLKDELIAEYKSSIASNLENIKYAEGVIESYQKDIAKSKLRIEIIINMLHACGVES